MKKINLEKKVIPRNVSTENVEILGRIYRGCNMLTSGFESISE